jgi:hypothetical protein
LYAGDDPINKTDPSGYAPCTGGINPDVIGCPTPLPLGNTSGANLISFVGGPCQATYVFGGILLDGGIALTPLSAGASFAVGAGLDIALAGAAKAA